MVWQWGGGLSWWLPGWKVSLQSSLPFSLTQCFRASGFGVRLLAGGERIEGTFEEVGEGERGWRIGLGEDGFKRNQVIEGQ